MAVRQTRFERLVPIEVQNLDSVTIPPYGAMRTAGAKVIDGVILQKAYQPNTTWATRYLLNGPAPIAPNGFGVGYWGESIWCACDTTPTAGDCYGIKPGQSTLSKGYPGGLIVDVLDTTNNFALIDWLPITSLLGKTTGSIATGNSGTINIWVGPGGSEVVSSGPMQITAFNRTGNTIATTKFVICLLVNGVWYAQPQEC